LCAYSNCLTKNIRFMCGIRRLTYLLLGIILKLKWNTCSISVSHYIIKFGLYFWKWAGKKIYAYTMSTIPETNFQFAFLNIQRKYVHFDSFFLASCGEFNAPHPHYWFIQHQKIFGISDLYYTYYNIIYCTAADPCKT